MTSPSPLERLAGPGNALAKEAPDAKEFAGLVRSGLARLKDAENEATAADSERAEVTDRRRAYIPSRSATEGSILAARRAGSHAAQTPTMDNTTVTPTIVMGSTPPTLNR
jgi:hypothetical protein